MIALDKNTGDLNIDGYIFPKQTEFIQNDQKDVYTSLDKKASSADNSPCSIIAYYKNGKLQSINLNLEPEYIKQNYKPPVDLDFRDYMTPFINFCKIETEKLLQTITENKLRHNWGKLSIVKDTRDSFVFVEIKYY